MIKDTLTPDALTVRAGDESSLDQSATGFVTVTIDETLEHNVSCRNDSPRRLGMGVDNSPPIGSNETAGLCFSRVGTVNFSVRPSSDTRTT